MPNDTSTAASPPRHIAILGSTGSIGTQALEVVRAHPGRFVVEVLTAGRNADLLISQALEFKPNAVAIADVSQLDKVKDALWSADIKVYGGEDAVAQLVEMESIQVVLSAIVGFAGLAPTMRAIEAGKHIAIANKETLVVAGELVTQAAERKNVALLPVDSEHSAIFQCLSGEGHNPIEKLILTASGGPFRGFSAEQLASVTLEQALKHPNWTMGAKITIDSASMMNKGLEVIEAKWLFDVSVDQIEVAVHPQSIVHSCVQFQDGSVIAQLGVPDMKLPIQYALGYPQRLPNAFPRFSFTDYPQLTFEQPDPGAFRNLQLAYDVIAEGGSAPCVLNAANEIAVAAFLKKEVGFTQMSAVIEEALASVQTVQKPSLEALFEIDTLARDAAHRAIKSA